MAYICELGNGQRLYLDNPGIQTLITLASSSIGQQQQASQSFATGEWVASPEIFRLGNGLIVRLQTKQGDRFLQIQSNRVEVLDTSPSLDQAQPMQTQQMTQPPVAQPMQVENMKMEPMQPMQPMKPLKMGDMQMSLNPMSMQMGNMSMQMGTASSESSHRFCSQCGTPVQLSDRFCSNCGHRLEQ